MHRFSLIVSVAALAFAAPMGAQQLGPSKVPDGHKPPPGMCRIWIDGVPPGRQAAPTDCPTAVRNRPSNGRVIWGDDEKRSAEKRDADRPTRGNDDRDRPRSTEEGERGRPSEPATTRGSDRPRETRGQEKPRESSEPAKPREAREAPRREPDERARATPPRKRDSEEASRKPERSNERKKPDFARRPR